MSNEFSGTDPQRLAECVALFKRAQMANRRAHTCHGKARQKAYKVKADLLIVVVSQFPDLVEINDDPAKPHYKIVFLANVGGLHLPAHYFRRTPSGYRAA